MEYGEKYAHRELVARHVRIRRPKSKRLVSMSKVEILTGVRPRSTTTSCGGGCLCTLRGRLGHCRPRHHLHARQYDAGLLCPCRATQQCISCARRRREHQWSSRHGGAKVEEFFGSFRGDGLRFDLHRRPQAGAKGRDLVLATSYTAQCGYIRGMQFLEDPDARRTTGRMRLGTAESCTAVTL